MAENAQTYIVLAEDCVRHGKLGSAADNYELALRFEKDSLSALCGLAWVHLRSDRLDEARRLLSRAMAHGEDHPQVLKLQAELHARSGRFDLAVKAIYMATEADLDQRARRRPNGSK